MTNASCWKADTLYQNRTNASFDLLKQHFSMKVKRQINQTSKTDNLILLPRSV